MLKVQKLLVSIFLFSILFSMIMGYNTQTVAAASDDEKVNIDDGDHVQEQIKANERVRFRFRERTRITVESKEKANCSINCDAKRIGDKDFEIEIETEDPHNLTLETHYIPENETYCSFKKDVYVYLSTDSKYI